MLLIDPILTCGAFVPCSSALAANLQVDSLPRKGSFVHVSKLHGSFEHQCQVVCFLLVTGNFFFAGARLFFRSLEAGIFLFSRVARIPEGSLVLPVIRTEEKITLGAELLDGTTIRGQNEISHPSAAGPGPALRIQPSTGLE